MNKKILFKDRLIHLRKLKGLTQYQLASELGFSRGQIGNYEQGSREPDTETILKIAKYFNVSIDYLLGTSDILIINEPETSLHRQVALKFADSLERDGYNLKENDLDDLILAAKVALEQKKIKNKK